MTNIIIGENMIKKYLFGAVLQAHIRIKVLKNIPAKRYDFFVYLRVILDICER